MGNGYHLTGESAGRQIWYQSENSIPVDAEYDFNPTKNPNSSDLLFRDIMTNKWSLLLALSS